MIDKYSDLYVFIEEHKKPFLINNYVMHKYSIINGFLYESGKIIGKVVAYGVGHKTIMKLGEHLCAEQKCYNCPLYFCCNHETNPDETLFSILEMKRTDMSKKVYKQLRKELKKKYETNH